MAQLLQQHGSQTETVQFGNFCFLFRSADMNDLEKQM